MLLSKTTLRKKIRKLNTKIGCSHIICRSDEKKRQEGMKKKKVLSQWNFARIIRQKQWTRQYYKLYAASALAFILSEMLCILGFFIFIFFHLLRKIVNVSELILHLMLLLSLNFRCFAHFMCRMFFIKCWIAAAAIPVSKWYLEIERERERAAGERGRAVDV